MVITVSESIPNILDPTMRILVAFFIISFLFTSCVKRPFVPVNVGREHGNPTTPWIVSHVPEKNRWALSRTDHHNFLQKIVCFNYVFPKLARVCA